VLRSALNQALRWGLVARNVATLVDSPNYTRLEVKPLRAEEVKKFLEAMKGDRLEALYLVTLALGLREGEVLGLRWQDVDLAAGLLRVNHALQRVGGKLTLIAPKTARSRRTLPVPASVVKQLRAHRARQGQERLLAGAGWAEGGFVFTTLIGTPIDARNLLRWYHALLTKAELPSFRFHDLRPSCATMLLSAARSGARRDGRPRAQPDLDDAGHLFTRHADHAARSRGPDGDRPRA
jgi:integrase